MWSLACQDATDLEEWFGVLMPLLEDAKEAKLVASSPSIPFDETRTEESSSNSSSTHSTIHSDSSTILTSTSTPTIEVIEALPPPPKTIASSPALTKRESLSPEAASPIYVRIVDAPSPIPNRTPSNEEST